MFLILTVLPAASGCASSVSKLGVVPWLDRPLPRYVTPIEKPIPYPTSAAPCRAGQLRVSQGRQGAGLGNDLDELVFTNTSTTSCLLRGYPTISAETPTGTRRVLHPQRNGTYFGRLAPADLAPGRHVFLDLATSAGCEGGRKPITRYKELVFTLPNGDRLRAGAIVVGVQCGLSMSEFGLQLHYSFSGATPGSPGSLQARLHPPAIVRAGTTLHYTVTLSNPTSVTVALDPRLGYTQAVYTKAGSVRATFGLNGSSVRSIPAHGQVRYAMQLKLPETAARGTGKLGWTLDTPYGPSSGAVIQVK